MEKKERVSSVHNARSVLSPLVFFHRCLFSRRSNATVQRVSVICLLGLMVAFSSLVIVFSVMDGLGKSIKEKFLIHEAHVNVFFKPSVEGGKNHLGGAESASYRVEGIREILKKKALFSHVKELYFFETVDLVVQSHEGVFAGATAKGYQPLKFQSFLNFLLQQARENMGDSEELILDQFSLPQKVEDSSSADSGASVDWFLESEKKILMGEALAYELQVYGGEEVSLVPAENFLLPPGHPFRFEKAELGYVFSAHSESWNSSYIFYDVSLFPSFKKNSSYTSGVEIQLQDPYQYPLYKAVLESQGYTVEVWPERNSSVFYALKIEKIIMSVFLSVAGFATLLAISCLLVLLIVQKKKETGILLAMGFPMKKIQDLFIKVGLLLCAFGLLGGMALGGLVCVFLKYFRIPWIYSFFPEGFLPVELNVWFIFLVGGCGMIFAFLSSWWSVKSQMRFKPADILKSVVR